MAYGLPTQQHTPYLWLTESTKSYKLPPEKPIKELINANVGGKK